MNDTKFYQSCCALLASAMCDEADARLVVTVTRRRKNHMQQRFYTAMAYKPDGTCLATCRHEIAPFDGSEGRTQRLLAIIAQAMIY